MLKTSLTIGVGSLITLGCLWSPVIAMDAMESTTEETSIPPSSSDDGMEPAALPTLEADHDAVQGADCPAGQFASAFSDVYPFHWAYTAVHNLTSAPIQCFNWPEDSPL